MACPTRYYIHLFRMSYTLVKGQRALSFLLVEKQAQRREWTCQVTQAISVRLGGWGMVHGNLPCGVSVDKDSACEQCLGKMAFPYTTSREEIINNIIY